MARPAETQLKPGGSRQADSVVPDCPKDMAGLCEQLAEYLDPPSVAIVVAAYEVAAAAHTGQLRRSGEAYITHPVAVASILADSRLDAETLAAAILHDTLEDTALGHEDIAAQFGETVADLVDGVTKLDRLDEKDRTVAAADSLRKMMLAMSRDLRVILIKLADRLHNMRTIESMSREAQRRIAAETLEIYAPIALRLGMNRFRSELQDLGFRTLHPFRYRTLAKRIAAMPGMRRQAIEEVEAALKARLERDGIDCRLSSRVKTPFSIYRKMQQEHRSFDQVMDVFGFRIVVPEVRDCYYALGSVHAQYKPLDGRFRDFIAIPKANGYQSLHTVLFGPFGSPIEVQIRTGEMDVIAERGIAAHWLYKSGTHGTNSAQARAHAWLSELLDSQRSTRSSLEFLDNVRVDLFPDEVYLFTPKGDILSLPRNATALDFAFAVHTDVGNHAVVARVDGKPVPLKTRLVSGQTVAIVTAHSAQPNPDWLGFVVTSKARTAIRHHLKRLQHEDAVDLGHRMLDRAFEAGQTSLERVDGRRLAGYLKRNGYRRLEDLLADVALGNRMAATVVEAVRAPRQAEAGDAQETRTSSERISITGSERGVLTFPQCCHPIPGDEIIGYVSAGKGIVVHRAECPNVAELAKQAERMVAIDWALNVEGDYAASLQVKVDNRPGVLAQVAAAIAAADSNIDAVQYEERDLSVSVLRFDLEVRSRKHLAEVIRRIRRLEVVHSVQRI